MPQQPDTMPNSCAHGRRLWRSRPPLLCVRPVLARSSAQNTLAGYTSTHVCTARDGHSAYIRSAARI